MKASDLMIGDWVVLVDPDTKKRTITRVHFSDLSDAFVLGLFEPIPITPEILEKNGMNPFDIDKLTEKATAKWWHKGGDFFIKQYHFKHQHQIERTTATVAMMELVDAVNNLAVALKHYVEQICKKP